MLRLGFIVAITGSKFFGGPPFSGALLLPPGLLKRIDTLTLPEGLADYSSRLDWPGELQAKAGLRWANEANLGLGLRWVAALSEMDRYFAAPGDLRLAVLRYFEQAAREKARGAALLQEVPGQADIAAREPNGILSFFMKHADGAPFSLAETAAIHARLRQPWASGSSDGAALAQIFHLGQPVAIGRRAALRICASAPLISEIAERVEAGESLEAAFAPWGRRLDALFEKWAALIALLSAQRAGHAGEP